MQTIDVTDNGLQLKRRSNGIVLKKEGKIVEEIPIVDLKRILIFGNNQLTTELLRYLAGKGIEVAFLSSNGRFYFCCAWRGSEVRKRLAAAHQLIYK